MAVRQRCSKAKLLKSKPVANRPKNLHQWSEESMLKAMHAVAKGKLGVNRAALEFNVSRTTLKDRQSCS